SALTAIISSDSGPIETTQAWLNDCLNEVNKIRANHQAPNLVMDNDLVNYAESRCPNLDAGHLCTECPPDAPGENIAQGYRATPDLSVDVDFSTCSNVIDYWASEEKDYDYAGNGANDQGVTGHFTALVWVETSKIGCAQCPGVQYEVNVVCNFLVAGNDPSNNSLNVFPSNS
ncbi:unnamed protein product, partial [Oppiella nova]